MTRSVKAQVFAQAKTLVDKGDVAAFRSLIEQHPALAYPDSVDANPPGPDNALLLHLVNWPGGKPNGADIAAVLLEAGADPNLRFKGTGETVLHWAVSNDKDAAIVTTLLDGGAEIEAPGGVIRGGTPLMNALYFGFAEIGALLVTRGAQLHNLLVAGGLGRTDLIEAWHRGNGQFCAAAARVTPTSPVAPDGMLSAEVTQSWTYSAVIAALCCGQFDTVDWFIDHGFYIDAIPADAGWSCLHHAAYRGSLDMARYLVARGADLEVRESNNATPANYAGAHGHPDVMHYLIDAGTRITLEQAAGCGRLDRVRDGIEQCADASLLLACTIGTTTDIGKPIHPSIMQGRLDVARFLLDRDPALRRATVSGVSVVEIARSENDQQMLSLLQDGS